VITYTASVDPGAAEDVYTNNVVHYTDDPGSQRATTSADVTVGEPLLVILESFTAEWTRSGVLVRWSTSAEIDNLGFRVLRETAGRAAEPDVLTPRLILSRGTDLSGARYQYMDPVRLQRGGEVRYYLEDIDLHGNVTRHGPVVVRPKGIGRPDRPGPIPGLAPRGTRGH
jgi:hypothetical protein